MNARKGAREGQLLLERKRLMGALAEDPRFADFLLRKDAVDHLLQDELGWLMNDVHPRPLDPSVLDRIPSPGTPPE
jgi:hypothetical protein